MKTGTLESLVLVLGGLAEFAQGTVGMHTALIVALAFEAARAAVKVAAVKLVHRATDGAVSTNVKVQSTDPKLSFTVVAGVGHSISHRQARDLIIVEVLVIGHALAGGAKHFLFASAEPLQGLGTQLSVGPVPFQQQIDTIVLGFIFSTESTTCMTSQW